MRTRLPLAVIVGCALSVALIAQDGLTPDLAAKARIAQLEAQVLQLQTEGAVCRAQFALALQPKEQQAQAQTRQDIEHAAGCVVDWTATPPVCKASP